MSMNSALASYYSQPYPLGCASMKDTYPEIQPSFCDLPTVSLDLEHPARIREFEGTHSIVKNSLISDLVPVIAVDDAVDMHRPRSSPA